MSRLKRNRKGRREQLIKFLNVRVKDSKLFKKEKKKEFINYTFIQRFKLGYERSIRFTALNRLLDFAASFRLRTRTRYIIYKRIVYKNKEPRYL